MTEHQLTLQLYTVLPFAQSMWDSNEAHDCCCLQVMKSRDRDEPITGLRKSAQQAVANGAESGVKAQRLAAALQVCIRFICSAY